MSNQTILTGIILDESEEFTLDELSESCDASTEWLLNLIEEGVIEPMGNNPENLRFQGICLRRIQIVRRLETDLGVNLAGAALALELLEEIEDLRSRVAIMEKLR